MVQAGNFTMKSPWTVKYFMVATFVVDYENQRVSIPLTPQQCENGRGLGLELWSRGP